MVSGHTRAGTLLAEIGEKRGKTLMPAPRQELPSLMPLRGIAALVVVAFHLRGVVCDETFTEMPVLIGHGYLAVDLFFSYLLTQEAHNNLEPIA